MVCKKCNKETVITLSEKPYCKSCFAKYFEKKVAKTISKYGLIGKKEKIGIAISGGKDSITLLYLLNKLALRRKGIDLVAIAIDEGIKNYRDKTLEEAKKFCKEQNIELCIFSYKKEFGLTLDEMKGKLDLKPCSICGVLRRYLLNKAAKELKVTKLATGHNLDDEAQSILMNQLRRNIATSARLGPLTGIISDKRFVRRIKPLYLMSEKEVATYAFLKNLLTSYNECPNTHLSYRDSVRDMINKFESKYPGSKHNIVNTFLEMLPVLKKKYEKYEINSCSKCGEPTSKEECQTCVILERIKTI